MPKKKRKNIRNSLHPVSSINVENLYPISAEKRKQTSGSMQISPHHNLARKSSNARLAAQQERQQKLKLVNSEHDTLVETPKQNNKLLKGGAIKLPKITPKARDFDTRITPKARDFSPMSMNDANESSMLSHKRRAVPKRARDNVAKAMSPVHD